MKRKSAAIWAFMLALIMVFSSAPVIYAEGEDTEAPSGSEAFCGEEDAGGELAAENEETDLSSGDVLTGAEEDLSEEDADGYAEITDPSAAEGATAGDPEEAAMGSTGNGAGSGEVVPLDESEEPHVHDFGDWTVTVEPTYFQTGTRVRTCSCGLTETETLAKLTGRKKWISDNGKRYYLGSNGKPVKGWHRIKHYKTKKKKWCYFDKKGVFRKSISKNTRNKWVKAGGYRFYFARNRKPVTQGFNFIRGRLYFMDKYGAVVYGKFKADDGHKYKSAKDGTVSEITYYKYKYRTFILVDISEQKLRYYRNRKLNMKADVVTGRRGVHDTPRGVFSIRSKLRNINLVGATWNSHVDYWMAFIGSSYGLHDASWRSSGEFSNHSTYTYNGSHGCINMRWRDAANLFNRVWVGTTVIVQD